MEDLSKDELIRHVGAMNDELLALRERLRAAEDQADFAGGSLKARTRLLNERVKELECVHAAVRLLRAPTLRPEQRAERIVDLLPAAFQHASDASARLVLGGREHVAGRARGEGPALIEPVVARGAAAGVVEVRYSRPHAFLDEERELLRTIAECLGAALER